MSPLLAVIVLIAGFFVLIKGADYLTEGASRIATYFGVSAIIIGLTIVSFGTSAPELTVSIIAAMHGKADITIGNVIGSNLANIGLILAVSALIIPLNVKAQTVFKEIPLALVVSLLIWIFGDDIFFQGFSNNFISRSEGIVFLIFFIIFMYYVFGSISQERRERKIFEKEYKKEVKRIENENSRNISLWKNIFYAAGGTIGIILGGKLIIESATVIARIFGMSEALIGLTVISIGTSLPELATSAVAAYKGQVDIAVGNIIGSNIFNVLLILGVTSIISPIAFNPKLIIDCFLMVIITAILFLFAVSKKTITRLEGAVLLSYYLFYIVFVVIRN